MHAYLHNIICTEQHGFRKRRSYETQPLEAINDLALSLNSNIQTDLLLLNMFYKIIHRIEQVNFTPYLHPSRRARGHQYHHSFLPATIRNWNCLSNYVPDSSNLNGFTNNLYMHTHTFNFDFCALSTYK